MAQYLRFQQTQRCAVLIAVLLTLTPRQGHTDESPAPSDRLSSDELQLLKEEEGVGIELQEGRPLAPLSSEPYVMIEEDIRESGAPDLPTLLNRMLGAGVPQVTGSEITPPARAGRDLVPGSLLVLVDGRPIRVDRSDPLTWSNIPVTVPDIQRVEMWRESASGVHGDSSEQVVVKITTKRPEN
jgi:iron complex outermembrane receptor protein